MGVSKCVYCQSDLDDRYNFCLTCNQQVKCTNCNGELVRDKTFCFHCGQPLVSQTVYRGQANEFTLEEKQTKSSSHRRINGHFSDEAFGQVAALFGGLTGSRPVNPLPTTYHQEPLIPIESSDGHVLDQTNELHGAGDRIPPHDPPASDDQDGSDKTKALELFKPHGENEVNAIAVDFKGKTWKEQQRRFILLYVWAFNEILGHLVPAKDNVIEAMKKVNVYDKNNTSKHYQEFANEFLLSTDQGLELNIPGSLLLRDVLTEISSEDEGYVYWKKTTKPSPKRTSLNKEDEQQVNEWVEKSVDTGDFDIRSLRNGTQWGMFAVWSITKRLGATSAVKPPMAYRYLTKKYTTVPVNQNAFSEALRRKNNANKFQKNADKNYYLTQQAEKEVESWIAAGKVEDTAN